LRRTCAALFASLFALAGPVLARTSYVGYSGAPGSRGTCASSCHGSSGGTITVSGFPSVYELGQTCTIVVRHSSGSAIRQFNLSVRTASGGVVTGTLAAGLNSATYTHSQETQGIHLSASNKDSCSFTWTAPDSGVGDVKLYLAGLQGTSTSGPNTALVLTAGQGTGVAEQRPAGTGEVTLSVQPSIVTRGLVLRVGRPAGSPAKIRVTDRVGRCVARFDFAGGTNSSALSWDCTGPNGARLAAGRYFVRLETGSSRVVRAFTIR
jgi:hypothetical protein